MGRHGGTRSRRFRRIAGLFDGRLRRDREPSKPAQSESESERRTGRLSEEAWILRGRSRAQRKARREHLQHVRRKNGKW